MKITLRDHIIADVRDVVVSYMIPAAESAGEIATDRDIPPMVRLQASFGILDRGGMSPQVALWREQRKEEQNAVQLDFWGKLLVEARDEEVDVEEIIRNDERYLEFQDNDSDQNKDE